MKNEQILGGDWKPIPQIKEDDSTRPGARKKSSERSQRRNGTTQKLLITCQAFVSKLFVFFFADDGDWKQKLFELRGAQFSCRQILILARIYEMCWGFLVSKEDRLRWPDEAPAASCSTRCWLQDCFVWLKMANAREREGSLLRGASRLLASSRLGQLSPPNISLLHQLGSVAKRMHWLVKMPNFLIGCALSFHDQAGLRKCYFRTHP